MAGEEILIVEDEEEIQELLRYNLLKEGFKVCCALDGEEAIRIVATKLPDLILLDLMLPGKSGLEVCALFRAEKRTKNVPIVMLTAKSEETDIVKGLELGADDYITKPFSPRVLVARIQAVLRRVAGGTTDDSTLRAPSGKKSIKVKNILIHFGRHEVLIDGNPLDLTSTEFRVLETLALRPGWVLTRRQIADEVHGADCPVTDRSIDVQIVALRRKMNQVDEQAGDYIQTVRGVGYRFKE
ncbi:MAG: response regulator [Pirellulales bacterium]|nr:response regulator [Pirellulales bacterium]